MEEDGVIVYSLLNKGVNCQYMICWLSLKCAKFMVWCCVRKTHDVLEIRVCCVVLNYFKKNILASRKRRWKPSVVGWTYNIIYYDVLSIFYHIQHGRHTIAAGSRVFDFYNITFRWNLINHKRRREHNDQWWCIPYFCILSFLFLWVVFVQFPVRFGEELIGIICLLRRELKGKSMEQRTAVLVW